MPGLVGLPGLEKQQRDTGIKLTSSLAVQSQVKMRPGCFATTDLIPEVEIAG